MKVGSFKSEAGREAYVSAYNEALAQMPAPTFLDVETGFGTVRAYQWNPSGSAAGPVLLLPGRSSGVPMWQENLPDLVGHRHVVAVDALGDAGLSVQTKPLTSMTDQASWVDEILGALDLHGVHLVGHSFGGATAAAVALHRPDRLASLALLEPAFTLAWPPVSTFFWATIASLPLPDAWRHRALAEIGGADVADVAKETPISRMIAAAASEFEASLPTPRPLRKKQLRTLAVPTYVAIADHDSLAGGSDAAERARAIPRVEVETWPDTTHSLPMQVHAAIGERLAAFWDTAEAG